MIVYVVSYDWSDSDIVGITTDKEKVERLMSVNEGKKYLLKVTTFDTNFFPKFNNVDPLWDCSGFYREEPEVKRYCEDVIIKDESQIKQLSKIKGGNPKYNKDYLKYRCIIQAKNEKEAAKIFKYRLSIYLIMKGGK